MESSTFFPLKIIEELSKLIIQKLAQRAQSVATAESCTGGLLAHYLTNVAGSSHVFKQGLVTYSNNSKKELLEIPSTLLKSEGAVSYQVAVAMAEGVRDLSHATFGLATTGMAPPFLKDSPVNHQLDGREIVSLEKDDGLPVGTLFLAIAQQGVKTVVWQELFPEENRLSFKEKALEALLRRWYSLLEHSQK